jgi:hypothetical protein
MADSVMSQQGEPANQLSSTKNLDNSDSDTDSEVHSFHLFMQNYKGTFSRDYSLKLLSWSAKYYK